MTDLRLVVFDVDGTLVDSQGDILAAMRGPSRAWRAGARARGVLGIVGLSLPRRWRSWRRACDAAAPRWSRPTAPPTSTARRGGRGGRAALSARARRLEGCAQRPTLLGVATGKSRRGLDALLDGHGLRQHFVTLQAADHHPSKPHPAMLRPRWRRPAWRRNAR